MYEQFFGFREKPFSLLPDPDLLYLGNKHSMALALLQYAILNQIMVTVLSGEIGSGKTTLIRHIIDQLGDEVNIGLISNTHADFGDLIQWVCLAYGLPVQGKDKITLYQDFYEYLIECYARGQRSILVIDESQNLDVSALEELRLLTNINSGKDNILQLVLVGQPELRQKFKLPGLEQFMQRVGVAYHLKPLDREETDRYIRHRIKSVGGDPDLFEPVALRFIHHQSGGIPRLINVICDSALVYAYGERRKRIDVGLVHQVVQDKIKTGLLATRKGYVDSNVDVVIPKKVVKETVVEPEKKSGDGFIPKSYFSDKAQ
ncbi:MAG: ExeA family protein [Gammaproteobacteria bacterium]